MLHFHWGNNAINHTKAASWYIHVRYPRRHRRPCSSGRKVAPAACYQGASCKDPKRQLTLNDVKREDGGRRTQHAVVDHCMTNAGFIGYKFFLTEHKPQKNSLFIWYFSHTMQSNGFVAQKAPQVAWISPPRGHFDHITRMKKATVCWNAELWACKVLWGAMELLWLQYTGSQKRPVWGQSKILALDSI